MAEHLWDMIKEIRLQHGMNKKEFAEALGCSPTLVTYIEKPFNVTKRTATVDIIRNIAKKFTSNDKERQELENRLLIKRARVVLATTISDEEFVKELSAKDELPEVLPAIESMPIEFIEALRADLDAMKDKNGSSYAVLVGNDEIRQILNGEIRIDADGIKKITGILGLPQDKYLVLAGYIPDAVARLYQFDSFAYLFAHITELSDAEIEAIGSSINILTRTILNAKNPPGRPDMRRIPPIKKNECP